MKTRTKALIGIGIGAAIGLGSMALIQPTFAHGDHQRFEGSRHGAHGHFGKARRMMRIFDKFDTNKDGVVTQEEIDKARADQLKRFDKDGDGKLSLKEYEALWLDAMRERMVDRFQRLDRDGDASVTLEEFVAPTRHLVFWMDRDDDGKVRMDELRRDRWKHHEKRHDEDNDRR